MTHALTPAALVLLAFCVAAETVRELCFKSAADRARAASRYAGAVVRQPLIWIGILVWTAETVAWLMVLERAPLGLAYPIMTATFAGIPLAGALFLRERLAPGQIVGVALVAAGVLCVGASGL